MYLGLCIPEKKLLLGFSETRNESWLVGTFHPDSYRMMTFKDLKKKDIYSYILRMSEGYILPLGMGERETFTFYFTFLYCVYLKK